MELAEALMEDQRAVFANPLFTSIYDSRPPSVAASSTTQDPICKLFSLMIRVHIMIIMTFTVVV